MPRTTALGVFGLMAAVAAGGVVRTQGPIGPPIPRGTNVLVGKVLELGTDAPVAGAIVTLFGYFDESGKPLPAIPPIRGGAPGPSAPRGVLSTSSGDFVFRDLPAGRYSMTINAFGYVTPSYPPREIELRDSSTPTALAVHVWKHGAISGTVVDEAGEPIAGVKVTALSRFVRGGHVVLQSSYVEAETDDRGVYRLAQLPPGEYVVGVLSTTTTMPAALAASIAAAASNTRAAFDLRSKMIPGGSFRLVETGAGTRIGDVVLQHSGPMPAPASDGRMQVYPTTFAPGATSFTDATSIQLRSGEQRVGLDIPLRAMATAAVSGVVAGPDGPLGDIAVRLIPPGAHTGESEPIGASAAISDGAGRFTFAAVAPGDYVLRAAISREAAQDRTAVSLWATQPLTVGDTDVDALVVTLRPGLRVSGRVEFRDATVRPYEQTRMVVSLRPVGAGSWRTFPGVVDRDGTFVTLGDPPGRYSISPAWQNSGEWTLLSVSQNGRPAPDDLVDLEGADIAGLVLTFGTAATLSGAVVDGSGATVPFADVVVFPADTTLWREGIVDTRRARLARATSSGAFTIATLAPGEYYVAAMTSRHIDNWQDLRFLESLLPGATRTSLGEGERKTLSVTTFSPKGR